MKISNLFKYIFLLSLIAGCGFKVVNQSELINFTLSNISTTGDNRIGYIIKNKLMIYSKNNKSNIIDLNIDLKKTKTIKERNIKNEITKFEIYLNASIEYQSNKNGEFVIAKNGSYTVSNRYSQSLNSEKKLIKTLSESIADDIVDELILRANDF